MSQDATTPDTDNSQTFRTGCREWLIDNCPPEMRDGKLGSEGRCWGGQHWTFENPAQEIWLEKCVEKGWTAPTWPSKYGGADLSAEQAEILKQEMKSLGIRPPLYSFGLTMLGPALLKYGTEAQKAFHLPPIVRGEIRWCQGYSEPNAGSDLASLSMKCEDQGDHWLLNGQKIWTSKADVSDWIFVMARTDTSGTKHQGITFILVNMQSSGLVARPIDLISGKSPFCETFFTKVKVPKNYSNENPSIVGEEGQGWEVGMYLLSHERGSLGGYTLEGRGDELPLIETALSKLGKDCDGKLDHSILRSKLALAQVDEAACIALAEQLNDKVSSGQNIGASSSLIKYVSTRLIQQGYELRMDIAGQEAIYSQTTPTNRDGTSLASNWLYSRAYTLLGGTSEIQLNIIAKHLLELPR
jgi:acyl-CoA dehydrogenase